MIIVSVKAVTITCVCRVDRVIAQLEVLKEQLTEAKTTGGGHSGGGGASVEVGRAKDVAPAK